MGSRGRKIVIGLLALAVTFGASGGTGLNAGAAAQNTEFVDDWIMDLPSNSISGEWLPDGRMLVVTRDGIVHVVDISNQTSQLVLEMSNVSFVGEQGALDLVLHPNFDANRKFFVYHVTATEPTRLRIVEFVFHEGRPVRTARSRNKIWESPRADAGGEFHFGGSLVVSADNKLLLTVGDGAVPAQSRRLNNVYGKVIRLNLDGTIPADNPFVNRPRVLDEIYAYGLRNPFRAWVDPATGVVWVGDVGSGGEDAYEEINQLVAGANYGWPACEGPLGQPKGGPDCPAGVEAPWYTYRHGTADACCSNGSITAGERYTGDRMPRQLRGSFLFGDWAENTISWVSVNRDGSAGSVGEIPVIPDAKPVWIGVGPDELIYYIRHNPFGAPKYELRRIRHSGAGDRAPVINSIAAAPPDGPAPLSTAFTADVVDPDGDLIGYDWDFGDGTGSTDANPQHTYDSTGRYSAVLVVTANGVSASETVLVQAGTVPTVAITSPAENALFIAGQQLTLSASGNDPDGPLPNSSYTWTVRFRHGNHEHETGNAALSGNPVTFDVPVDGHNHRGVTGFEIAVTVTDSDGLTATDSVSISPAKVDLIIRNGTGEGTVVVDGVTRVAPFELDTLVGFRHTIGAVTPQCLGGVESTFAGWSDGGARSHAITVPARNATYTANFSAGAACDPSATRCMGQVVTVDLSRGQAPTNEDDVILGTAGPDVIDALGGNDYVCALAGADVVDGGLGRDRIDGGRGPDRLSGGMARDVIVAGAGADWVDGGRGRDRISGNQGDDVLRGAAGIDNVNAADGNDRVLGGAGNDRLRGGPGADAVDGGADVDFCIGFESTRRCE